MESHSIKNKEKIICKCKWIHRITVWVILGYRSGHAIGTTGQII